ncbi:MAG: DUF2442 domain-containing protein [Pseudomonadota bacterium]
MHYDIISFRLLQGRRIELKFKDGCKGVFDLSPRLDQGRIGGVFDALCDAKLFRKVKLVDGVLTWPGEIDVAPDALWQDIKRDGVAYLEPSAARMAA